MPIDQGPQVPGGPAQRPAAGPVVPLTAVKVTPEELIGGTRVPPRAPIDATATRVLTKGEPISAPTGRADDFSWPRGGPANAEPAAEPATTPAPATAPPAAAKKPGVAATPPRAPATDAQGQQAGQAGQANQAPRPAVQRPRPNTDAPRPPLSIQGLFR